MFRSLFCLSLLLCFLVPLFASESLTLNTDEVVRLVLEKNFAIKRTELQTKIAEENLRETKSLFDTNLSAEAFHNVDTSARASTFFWSSNRHNSMGCESHTKDSYGHDNRTLIHQSTSKNFWCGSDWWSSYYFHYSSL